MGVSSRDFYDMCMYQFQSVRAAFCLQHGFREDGSDPDKMSATELQDLMSKVAGIKEAKDGVQT